MAIGICMLCLCTKDLQASHIIPSGYLKSFKKGRFGEKISSQVYTIPSIKDEKTLKLSNWNQPEYLLCFDCEQHFSKQYESYGIDYLRNKANRAFEQKYVIFSNYNYQKLYIYLISIFWRISISQHKQYAGIQMSRFNEKMRYCLLNNTLRTEKGIHLTAYIRIALLKLMGDPEWQNHIDDGMHLEFECIEKGSHVEVEGVMNGLLIRAFLEMDKNARSMFISGEIKDKSNLIVPYYNWSKNPKFVQYARDMQYFKAQEISKNTV